MYEWHALVCSDCGTTVAFSTQPITATEPTYCYLCALSHAQVATWMMPHNNNLSANSLYGKHVNNNPAGFNIHCRSKIEKVVDGLQANQAAKLRKKLDANGN